MNEIPLTQGFNNILVPALTEMDQAMTLVQKSQDDLGKEIERLIAELELFQDIATPPTLLPSLEKLLDAKKRLVSTNQLLQKTNDRVEKIQKSLQ